MAISINDLHLLAYLQSELKASMSSYQTDTTERLENLIDESNVKLEELGTLSDYVKKEPGKGLFSGKYTDISGTPTNVSEFTNDSNYATKAEAKGYADTVDGKATDVNNSLIEQINSLKSAVELLHSLRFMKVDELPETGEENVIYLMLSSRVSTNNIYAEYIWIEGQYEQFGTTEISLDGYAKVTDNVASATKLEVSRSINGVPFDGTKDITIESVAKSESAATADKLKNPMIVQVTGAVTAEEIITDGSEDVTIDVTELDATKLNGTASVDTTGNASTSDKTNHSLNINGNKFDGSSDISINLAPTILYGPEVPASLEPGQLFCKIAATK